MKRADPDIGTAAARVHTVCNPEQCAEHHRVPGRAPPSARPSHTEDHQVQPSTEPGHTKYHGYLVEGKVHHRNVQMPFAGAQTASGIFT